MGTKRSRFHGSFVRIHDLPDLLTLSPEKCFRCFSRDALTLTLWNSLGQSSRTDLFCLAPVSVELSSTPSPREDSEAEGVQNRVTEANRAN
jgi:hypothetical protein